MATQTVNLTEDGTDTLVATLNQKHKWNTNKIGIHAYGDFGGGALTFKYSLDGGATKMSLKDDGSAISWTESDVVNWDSPVSSGQQAITVYATLSGSTSPDINLTFIDQNIGN